MFLGTTRRHCFCMFNDKKQPAILKRRFSFIFRQPFHYYSTFRCISLCFQNSIKRCCNDPNNWKYRMFYGKQQILMSSKSGERLVSGCTLNWLATFLLMHHWPILWTVVWKAHQTVHWGQITKGKTQGLITLMWRKKVWMHLCFLKKRVGGGGWITWFLKNRNQFLERRREMRYEDGKKERSGSGGWEGLVHSFLKLLCHSPHPLPCCCRGRWWPVISVLSLSSEWPDNQWALLGGAGAKLREPLLRQHHPPLQAPSTLPSSICWRLCICTRIREKHKVKLYLCVCVCLCCLHGCGGGAWGWGWRCLVHKHSALIFVFVYTHSRLFILQKNTGTISKKQKKGTDVGWRWQEDDKGKKVAEQSL